MTARPIKLPDDEPAILSFIQGLQDYELGFENNRRRDPAFVADHWRDAQHRCAEKHGAMLIAEQDGKKVGWISAYEEHGELFIAEPERRHGFIAEIFVNADARGQGTGGRRRYHQEAKSRVSTVAVHICTMVPMATVTANPFTGPEPKPYKQAMAIRFVTLESRMVPDALV